MATSIDSVGSSGNPSTWFPKAVATIPLCGIGVRGLDWADRISRSFRPWFLKGVFVCALLSVGTAIYILVTVVWQDGSSGCGLTFGYTDQRVAADEIEAWECGRVVFRYAVLLVVLTAAVFAPLSIILFSLASIILAVFSTSRVRRN